LKTEFDMSGLTKKISLLKQRLEEAKKDLSEIGEMKEPLPELINSANLLRSNEYLFKVNEKKSNLLVAFEVYAEVLVRLVSFLEIKKELSSLKKKTGSRKSKPKLKSTKNKRKTSKKIKTKRKKRR